MNGKAHAVTLDDGRECTAWCDKIDSGRLQQIFALHEDVEFMIVPYKSEAGKEGLNITGIVENEPSERGLKGKYVLEHPVPTQRAQYTASKAEERKQNLPSERDRSIIAQCMVKAVMGQPLNFATDVCTIEDAVAMYKKAYELL